jgi:hypothetical protein
MFQNEISKLPNTLTVEDYENLSQSSTGYSGRDIKAVVKSCWTTHVKTHKNTFIEKRNVPLTSVIRIKIN